MTGHDQPAAHTPWHAVYEDLLAGRVLGPTEDEQAEADEEAYDLHDKERLHGC